MNSSIQTRGTNLIAGLLILRWSHSSDLGVIMSLCGFSKPWGNNCNLLIEMLKTTNNGWNNTTRESMECVCSPDVWLCDALVRLWSQFNELGQDFELEFRDFRQACLPARDGAHRVHMRYTQDRPFVAFIASSITKKLHMILSGWAYGAQVGFQKSWDLLFTVPAFSEGVLEWNSMWYSTYVSWHFCIPYTTIHRCGCWLQFIENAGQCICVGVIALWEQ